MRRRAEAADERRLHRSRHPRRLSCGRRSSRSVDRPQIRQRVRFRGRWSEPPLVADPLLDRRHRNQHRHLPEHSRLRLLEGHDLAADPARIPFGALCGRVSAPAAVLQGLVLHRLRCAAPAFRGRRPEGGVGDVHHHPQPRRRPSPLPLGHRSPGDEPGSPCTGRWSRWASRRSSIPSSAASVPCS